LHSATRKSTIWPSVVRSWYCQIKLALSKKWPRSRVCSMTEHSPFRYFKTSPEIIRLAVMMYIRFPLSLPNVEDLLHERGIDISHETVRFWWNRFGPLMAVEIKQKRIQQLRTYSKWKWHIDEVFVKIKGDRHLLALSLRPDPIGRGVGI